MTDATRGAGPDPGPARLHPPHPTPRGRLWVVRHGETDWSRSGQHTSRTDLALTRRGEEQAAGLAGVLGPVRPALVLSSPRQRAVRTARLAGFSPEVDEDLAEWDYGEYEGLTAAQIRMSRPDWTIWTGGPLGGETAAQVATRADRVLDRIRAALATGNVLVVGHGHFSRALTARWLGQPVAAGALFALEPAAPCVLGWESGTPAMLHWNLVDPARLAGAADAGAS